MSGMDRRLFLKFAGLFAAASSLQALPVSAQTTVLQPLNAPGTYQFSGRVRLDEPLVEISGITNAQQISWSALTATGSPPPVASFTSFERFDAPWSMPSIRVRGGQLEAL